MEVYGFCGQLALKRLNLLLDYLMARTSFTEGVHLTEVMDGSGTHCLCPWFPVLLAPLAHQCRKSSCYRSWNQRQVGTTPLPSPETGPALEDARGDSGVALVPSPMPQFPLRRESQGIGKSIVYASPVHESGPFPIQLQLPDALLASFQDEKDFSTFIGLAGLFIYQSKTGEISDQVKPKVNRASEPILLHLFHELEGLVRPTNGIRFESDSRSIHIRTAHLTVLSGDSLNDSNLTRHRVSAAFPKPTPSLASKPEEGQQLTETSPLAGKSRDPLSPWLFKSAVKSQGSTLDRRWKLPSWSTVGAEGISGGAVKCEEIGDSGAHRMESPRALLHFTSDVGLPFPSDPATSTYSTGTLLLANRTLTNLAPPKRFIERAHTKKKFDLKYLLVASKEARASESRHAWGYAYDPMKTFWAFSDVYYCYDERYGSVAVNVVNGNHVNFFGPTLASSVSRLHHGGIKLYQCYPSRQLSAL
uniref:Uncharacterized protein n=1 Tax=Salix viminalis TaxID=40686 RepID=A0A6N2KPQ1_SALVM